MVALVDRDNTPSFTNSLIVVNARMVTPFHVPTSQIGDATIVAFDLHEYTMSVLKGKKE